MVLVLAGFVAVFGDKAKENIHRCYWLLGRVGSKADNDAADCIAMAVVELDDTVDFVLKPVED